MQITETIWNILNPTDRISDAKVKPIWSHSESMESLMAILVQKKLLGIPKKQIWREMGYDEQKIATMEADANAEAEAAAAGNRLNTGHTDAHRQSLGGMWRGLVLVG